jgi:lysophospholipase L1-like esterase
MPLGDSVTAGGGTAVNGGPPPGSYRAPLYTSLTSAGYNVQYVGDQTINPGGGLPSNEDEHEGIGGITIEALQSYLQQNNILTTYKPDLILLIIGNNDMFTADNPQDPQATYALLATFCQYIVATLPKAKIIVSTVQPHDEPGTGGQQEADQYNQLILSGIGSVSANISAVDINAAMTYDADIGPDGTHPNVAGDQAMANVFLAGIEKLYGSAR